MSLTPTFQGEVQMRRWSDSSTQGVQITFGLPDSEALEPLKHKAGKRFMAVLVEIGDDEQPVQPPRKDTRGPLCREACDLCRNPDYWQWIDAANEKEAEERMKEYLRIGSRTELDANEEVGRRFINGIRVPFMSWLRVRRSVKP